MRLIYLIFVMICFDIGFCIFEDQEMDPCKAGDYHYELTECDSEKGRWRVQVPSSGSCADVRPNPATRINNCRISCEPGHYFDLGDLKCRMCRPGTFSLGGGILFDNWENLPEGFYTQLESFRSAFSPPRGRENPEIDCSGRRYGWQPRGDYIASLAGPCASTLTYTVHLVKPGHLSYTYQYADKDIIFDFEAQNDQCQSVVDSKEYRWPPATREGEWKKQTVQLSSGQNVLTWKTIGMDTRQGKAVLIKEIEISGVDFMSSCTPCRAGTYSQGGARQCLDCPENSFSTREANYCSPCNNITEYARRGSPTCYPKQLCTRDDYFSMREPCDKYNNTKRVYQWIEPKICRDDLAEAVRLPPPEVRKGCPPCSPGMEYRNGSTSCEFCPKGTYSDGKVACKICPAHTTPNYGYQINHWTELPSIMQATCMGLDGSSCSSTMGWQVAGGFISSGHRHIDGSYLMLSLHVSGFRSEGSVPGNRLRHQEVGRISFTFQLECEGKCELMFMRSTIRDVYLVNTWIGSQEKQTFVHSIMSNDTYVFNWAFQTLPSMNEDGTPSRIGEDDEAKIYSISVTNTVSGGAANCLPCRNGLQEGWSEEGRTQQCLQCPPGSYMSPNTSECMACPHGLVMANALAYGEETCEPCGPGLITEDGTNCITNCVVNLNQTLYDFRSLAGPAVVRGTRLYSTSKMAYYHLFNISLCGVVTCSDNVPLATQGLVEQNHVDALICRTTIVPSQNGEEAVIAAQSRTLADQLMGITYDTTFMGMNTISEFVNASYEDLHFYFSTSVTTRSCPQGRNTIITFRCDPMIHGNGTIQLPTKCPAGSCDGCNFDFLWTVDKACPICAPNDFRMVRGECINNWREIHHLPTTRCILPGSVPETNRVRCSTAMPLGAQIAITVSVAVIILVSGMSYYFYQKNKHLEFKYMKLVSASGRDEVEMAPAESCALDDGEEEEVQFTRPPKQGILNRMIGSKNKRKQNANEHGNQFESVHLTECSKEHDKESA